MPKNIIIIGGGLAGLVSAILLNRQGFDVTLFEKKTYPFHRVCGEYISNEVADFLKNTELFPPKTSAISLLEVSSPSGTVLSQQLPLGGFGVSRYAFDWFLAEKAKKEGVQIMEGTSVEELAFQDNRFTITIKGGEQKTVPLVIGAFGKRSTLDKKLNRTFMKKRSPYMGVKYHIKTDFPENKIALHNFQGGYCGISKVEEDTFNLCYLTEKAPLKRYKDIPTLEQQLLCENPKLRAIYENSDFIFDTPEVINEISFSAKQCVENHILMVGDTSGLITPLCGNGMAMAIHGATLLSRLVPKHYTKAHFNREQLEKEYTKVWQQTFGNRLKVGRTLQGLFGDRHLTNLAVNILKFTPQVTSWMIQQTHGQPFAAQPSEIPS